jgi:aspartyl protease family protein
MHHGRLAATPADASSAPRESLQLGLRRNTLPHRFMWIVLIGLGVALSALLISSNQDPLGLDLTNAGYAIVVAQAAIAAVLGASLVMMVRYYLPQSVQSALFWTIVGIGLAAGYGYRFEFVAAGRRMVSELRHMGERVLSDLTPGRPLQIGRSVEIARGRGGDFQVQTQVNGAPVRMILDTGASAVVLTQDDAMRAGLPLDLLHYTVEIETANGHARAAEVSLKQVSVLSITEREVPALIAQPGQLKESLLGMSFLNRLESYEMRGDKLLMRPSQ